MDLARPVEGLEPGHRAAGGRRRGPSRRWRRADGVAGRRRAVPARRRGGPGRPRRVTATVSARTRAGSGAAGSASSWSASRRRPRRSRSENIDIWAGTDRHSACQAGWPSRSRSASLQHRRRRRSTGRGGGTGRWPGRSPSRATCLGVGGPQRRRARPRPRRRGPGRRAPRPAPGRRRCRLAPPAARARRSASRWSSRPSASWASASSWSGSPGTPDSSRHVAIRSRSNAVERRASTAPTRSCSTRPAAQAGQARPPAPRRTAGGRPAPTLDPAGVDHLDQAPGLELLDVVAAGQALGGVQRHLLADGHDLERRPGGRRRAAAAAPPPARAAGPARPRPASTDRGPSAPVARRSTAAVTSSRTNRALPRLSCQMRSSSDAGTRSPSTASTSSSVAPRRAGPTSSRLEQLVLPQRHQAGRAAARRCGRSASTRIGDWVTARCSSATDTSSSRWASSTASRNRAAAGPVVQAGQRQVQQVVALVGLVAGVEHVGERPQRDGPGRLGGPHPLDRRAPGLQGGDRLGDEAGLADARLAEQDRPAGPAVQGEQAADRLQLCVSSHEWPRCDHGPRAYCGEIRRTYGSATTGDAVG